MNYHEMQESDATLEEKALYLIENGLDYMAVKDGILISGLMDEDGDITNLDVWLCENTSHLLNECKPIRLILAT
jgi:hypothetical protein